MISSDGNMLLVCPLDRFLKILLWLVRTILKPTSLTIWKFSNFYPFYIVQPVYICFKNTSVMCSNISWNRTKISYKKTMVPRANELGWILSITLKNFTETDVNLLRHGFLGGIHQGGWAWQLFLSTYFPIHILRVRAFITFITWIESQIRIIYDNFWLVKWKLWIILKSVNVILL